MAETRLRAVIREEIALAMKTLEEQTYSSDPDDDPGLDRALSGFNAYAYRGACEAADEARAENPFAVPQFRETDPDTGAETNALENVLAPVHGLEDERRRVTHAAAYLPAVDLNALDAGAYKLLGSLSRNDEYTNAVIRLVQHGGPRIGRPACDHTYDLADDGNGHSGWVCVHCGDPRPS